MKWRTKKARRRALNAAPNPLRLDPTRTLGLRLVMERELGARVDAALNVVTANVFCATGEGGGVDPTCSPVQVIGKGSTGEVVRSGDVVSKPATKDEGKIYSMLAGVDGVAAGRKEGDKIVTPFFPNIVSVDVVPEKSRKSMGPVVVKELPRLVNAVTALGEAGYDYNDPIQVGFDKSRRAHLFDFSNAVKTPDATRQNLSHLATYLDQFGVGKHAAAMRKVGSVMDYLDPDARLLDSDSSDAVAGARVYDRLDGKSPRYAYYSFNAREIPKVAQSEHDGGVKVVFSPSPLSDEFMKSWELHPAIHRTDSVTETVNAANDTLPAVEDPRWWGKHLSAHYLKGLRRGFNDATAKRVATGALLPSEVRVIANELVANASGPAVEKVRKMVNRTLKGLRGITSTAAKEVRRIVAEGIAKGQSPYKTATQITKQVADVTKARARLIARTETIRAHAEGQLDAMEAAGVQRLRVNVEFHGTTGMCRTCSRLDGKVFTMNQARGLIPAHPNAVFAHSTFTSYGECEELVRAWYDGPAVVLTLWGRGDRTTIGPNHPVMTRRGMVKAAELEKGDEVLYDTRHDFHTEGPNLEQVITVKDAFEAARRVTGHTGVVPSPSDLHGDRVFCQGEVEAVRPERGLLPVLDSFGVEQLRQHEFARSDTHLEFGSGAGPLLTFDQGLFPASNCVVCGGDVRGPDLRRGRRHSQPHHLRSGAKADAPFSQPPHQGVVTDPETGRDLGGLLPRDVPGDHVFVWRKLHDVSSTRYRGWAFDATTATSLYCSDGFVVSNCRCAWTPAVGSTPTPNPARLKRLAGVVRNLGVESWEVAAGELLDAIGVDPAEAFAEVAANAFGTNYDPHQRRDSFGRWTDGGAGQLMAPRPSPGDKAKTYAEAAKLVRKVKVDGKKLTAAESRKLGTTLAVMTVADINRLKKEFGVTASGKTKAVLIEKVRGALKPAAKPKPPPKPKKVEPKKPDPKPEPEPKAKKKKKEPFKAPPIDYQHKDPNHPVVRDMFENEDLNRKVKEFHDWAAERGRYIDAAKTARQLTDLAWNKYQALKQNPKPGDPLADKAFDEWSAAVKARSKAEQEMADFLGKESPRDKLLTVFAAARPVTLLRRESPDMLALGKNYLGAVEPAERFVSKMVGGGGSYPYESVATESGRAYYVDKPWGGGNTPQVAFDVGKAKSDFWTAYNESTQVHELGHMVEHRKHGVQQKVLDFLAYRVGTEPARKLKDEFPGSGYGDDEVARKDKFDRAFSGSAAWYVGKEYPQKTTEVVSMGLQKLHEDPVEFVRKDPEYFHFLMSVLK